MLEENQFNVQGYNIVNILKRLESATSRLEGITRFQEESYKSSAVSQDDSEDKGATSETLAKSEKPEPAEKVKFLQEFEELIKIHVEPFVENSRKIDLVVGEVAGNFKDAFVAQTRFLAIVSQTQKPDVSDPAFMEALQPINEKISAIGAAKDANRRSEYFNHLNTLSDGAPVLGWIVSDTPVSFISDIKESAQFWANRVIKDFKEKDTAHSEWVKSFYALFDALRAYVKEYHTTGPSWNPKGKLLKDTLAADDSSPTADDQGSSSGKGPSENAPPPPPPPAPPANLFEETSKPESSGGLGAVFADLNKGADVTAGLKKVDRSQMTHKNPELRQQAALQRKPTPPKKPTSLSSKTNVPQKKPARKELVDGSKWIIENFTAADAPEPIVIEVERTQSVFIGKTSGVTIQIKGKGNAVSISETKKTGVVVDSLISGVDVIKSFKFGLQVTGVAPLISVDKCEEGSIYLSQDSVSADSQVISSNTTALNINVIEGDDFVEIPVPEQLIHTIKNGKLVSEVVEHAG